jgi:hypothetical protein
MEYIEFVMISNQKEELLAFMSQQDSHIQVQPSSYMHEVPLYQAALL